MNDEMVFYFIVSESQIWIGWMDDYICVRAIRYLWMKGERHVKFLVSSILTVF